MVSLVVSLAVLVYEIYLWVKECCGGESNKVAPKKGSDASEADNRLNPSMNSIESEANEKGIPVDLYDESELYN